jgi:hypothetical protein
MDALGAGLQRFVRKVIIKKALYLIATDFTEWDSARYFRSTPGIHFQTTGRLNTEAHDIEAALIRQCQQWQVSTAALRACVRDQQEWLTQQLHEAYQVLQRAWWSSCFWGTIPEEDQLSVQHFSARVMEYIMESVVPYLVVPPMPPDSPPRRSWHFDNCYPGAEVSNRIEEPLGDATNLAQEAEGIRFKTLHPLHPLHQWVLLQINSASLHPLHQWVLTQINPASPASMRTDASRAPHAHKMNALMHVQGTTSACCLHSAPLLKQTHAPS